MSTTTVERYQESRSTAEAHGENWADYEDDIVRLGEDLLATATLLGRTTYAVARRRYVLAHGASGAEFKVDRAAATYRGWTCEMGDE
jgi:hypothetical protein